MKKALTVSIVTYNSAKDIVACLQSLKKQTFTSFELIIVDNASTDKTIQEVTRIFPEARIIQLHKNIGFGAAHNIAIQASHTPYFMVLNPDCLLKENAVRRLINAAELHEDAGVIGPCIMRSQGDTIVDTTGLLQTWYGAVKDRGSGEEIDGTQLHSTFVWGVSGACALYRREALEDIRYEADGRPEYFDEHYFMYKEDADLAARLQKADWTAWYQHDAIAYHDRTGNAQTTRKDKKEYIKAYSYQNHLLYSIKNIQGVRIIPAIVYEIMKFVYLLLFERATLKVLPAVIRAIPETLNRRYE
jgi:GT2 family glycosyltransferase